MMITNMFAELNFLKTFLFLSDQCYKDASHYWPLDKSTVFVQDLNKEGIAIGKIHGPWTIKKNAC